MEDPGASTVGEPDCGHVVAAGERLTQLDPTMEAAVVVSGPVVAGHRLEEEGEVGQWSRGVQPGLQRQPVDEGLKRRT